MFEAKLFTDRHDAGKKLGLALASYKETPSILIIGLPRGGVVLAYEVARMLGQPLDVICPRKVGAPHNPELAIAAVTETGQGYFNTQLIEAFGVSSKYLDDECQKQQAVALKRLALYRKNMPPLDVDGKTIILVDDGLATGATMKAAIESIKQQNAAKIVVAVPVAPSDTAREITQLCDEFICLAIPREFYAVGQFYEIFDQTEDDEVIALLEAIRKS